MNRLILFSFVFLLAFTGKSQTIENVDFKFIDEKILIYYDLVNCTDGNKYEVEIKFSDEKGNIITPRNLTGDFGVISCGKNKKAVWDLFQEVEKFEGNYKTIVTIINTFDSKGRSVIIVSDPKKLRITKSEKTGDQIMVQINRGEKSKVKSSDLFFVTSDKKITNTSGKSFKKTGKISITEIQNDSSRGVFSINNSLNYELVQNSLKKSNLSKFKKFNAYINSTCFIGDETGTYGFNLGCELYSKNNNSIIGLEVGKLFQTFNHPSTFDLAISLSLTPHCLNSRYLSLGVDFHILSNTFNYTGHYWKYKPRGVFYVGFQYNRVKLMTGILVGNAIEIYDSYYGERDYLNINASVKLSISIYK